MERMPAAEEAIRDRIGKDGRLTFAQFMEMALYTAPGCYYGSRQEKIGAGGDYFTSPELHPSFGALLARQLEQVWVAMGSPSTFALVEMGAGTGALARDILTCTSLWAPHFHRSIAYTIVERSRALVETQQRTLSQLQGSAGRVIWQVTQGFHFGRQSIEGCLLSNELLDSLPVHRLMRVGDELKEIYVEILDGQFVETLGPLSDPKLGSYFHRLGMLPEEGCRVEVNLAAVEWAATVARVLKRGAILTIDYGYSADEMYSQHRRDGTLLCFHKHTLNSDPYARIGLQDMTTHVDFTSLSLVGSESGLQTLGLTTQHHFLKALGMEKYLTLLSAMELRRIDYEANRMAMLELLKPEGLGRIKVLLQHKGLEGLDPAGLRQDGIRPEDLGRETATELPPLLTPSHMHLTTPPSGEEMIDTEDMWRELMGEGEA